MPTIQQMLDHATARTRSVSSAPTPPADQDSVLAPGRPSPPRWALKTLVLSVAVAGVAGGCAPSQPDRAGAPARPSTSTVKPAEPDGSSRPPWPAPTDVPARVAAAGLDLGPMGMAEHYHPQLRILIHGLQVPVPANIGVDPATGDMSALHTHETDGTIHIEADTVGEKFTLGQLFTEWGVKLTPTQIGGVKATNGQKVSLTSNGAPIAGPPQDLRLAPDQQIVLELP